MTERKANIILFLCAVVWGGGFIAGKMALTTLSPYLTLTIRFGLATLCMWILFHSRIRHTPKSTVSKGLKIGILQASALLLQLIGLNYTTTAKQSFLVPSYVVLVPFLSLIIYRKSPGLRAILSGFISILGIGLITINETFRMGLGDTLSIFVAVIFGIQILYIGHVMDEDTDVVQISFYQYAFVTLIGLVICLTRGMMAGDVLSCFDVSFNLESLIGVLYLGTLNTVFAFTAQNKAQIYTKSTTAALIMGFESVFGFLFSIMYYDEPLTLRFVIGGILCFLAIILSTVSKIDFRESGS